MTDQREPSSAPLLLTIEQAARRLSISRAMVYRLIQHSSLKVVHLGRATRISTSSLEQWVREQELEQQ
jgi:excisionase family DNA binding protein